jgi:serine/threonine protein kinase/tetratricopeptide (TPR) repeat protein
MPDSPITLGPYRLFEKIGQGGMGDVWRAEHAIHPIPVAVKVMRDEPLSSRARITFLNEIRQVAKLDHQGIAMVYDFGKIAPADAAESQGILRVGHPYIAIEFAQRGSLDMLNEVLTWRDLLGIVRALLMALAHAHSRGVLHRDIKPGNVLLGSGEDLRPSIKLTDFGLALARESAVEPGSGMRIVGTPVYMAPEQIEGLWRDQGPWTDLYSLGCVAYELASGHPPFQGENPRAIAIGHMSSPVPPLRAMSEVPDGFEQWIQRMLAKEPYERFQGAADAAHALAKIVVEDDEAPARPARTGEKPDASPTWTFLELPPPRSIRKGAPTPPAMHPLDAPPIPSDWRDLERLPENRPMLGEGLNLFGIRTHRLVGRTDERDRLWRALEAVSIQGQPRAVVLSGPTGLGKRKLARWLMETAREAGAATAFEATHSAIPNPADGLPRMIARHLGCIGASGTEVIERTEHMLRLQGVDDPFEWEHLGRMLLVTSGAVSSAMSVPAGTARECQALMERYLERMTVHRPIVVHISDAQFGLESLQLVHRLLRPRVDRLPVLVVLSCDIEAMDLRAMERHSIGLLADHPNSESLFIGPLNAAEQQALIQDLLRVDPVLAKSVADRSGGSPLFAIQLVEDWVQRGVLRPGVDGLALVPGEAAELPDSIHEVCQARFAQAISDMPEAATTAIWTAAALGINVHEEDWSQACAALRIDVPDPLWTRIVDAGLAETNETGWAFSHGMLRESLERAAGAEWRRINLGCANMLAARGARRGLAERIGRHLVAADEAEDCLEHLLNGAMECIHESAYGRASDLLDTREQQMNKVAIPESDARWGAGWIPRLMVQSNLREVAKATELSSRFATQAMRNGWTILLSPAFRFRGIIAFLKGDYAEADAMFARAESHLRQQDVKERASIHVHWGRTMQRLGLRDEALFHLEKAKADFDSLDNQLGVAACLHGMAALFVGVKDNPARAMTHLREALQIYETLQNPMGAGDCWNGIAEVHRQRGDLALAHSAYQTALTYLVRSGASRAVVPVLNLGLVLLKKGDTDKAADQFELGLETASSGGRDALAACAHVGLMAVAGIQRDWEAWDVHASGAAASIESTGIADRDLAWPAELAGDRAAVEGKRDRAEFAWKLAVDQWTRIGAEKEANRLIGRMKPIEG